MVNILRNVFATCSVSNGNNLFYENVNGAFLNGWFHAGHPFKMRRR